MDFLRSSSVTPVTAAVTAALLYFVVSRVISPPRRKRRLSFGSEAMLNGAFPTEAKVQQPVIGGVFYFEKLPSLDDMASKFGGLFIYDRMRSGVRKTRGGKLVLHDLADRVDAKRDLIRLVHVKNEDEIRAMVNDLCDTPLELGEDKLLWRVTAIHNEDEQGKSAVFVQLHHSIGDGIAMVSILQKMFNKPDGSPFTLDIAEKMRSADKSSSSSGSKFGFIFKILASLVEILGLGMSKYDTDTAFLSNHSASMSVRGKRHSMEFPAIRLDIVKEIKNRAKVTINDVLMGVTSGMLRRYLLAKGDSKNITSLDQKTHMQVRALLPVAFPRPKKHLQSTSRALRNLWSFVSAPFTVNEATPKERISACAKITKELKKAPTAFIQLFLQNQVVSRLPQFLQRQIPFDIFSRHTIVFSNVPGPGEQIALCSEPVLGMYILFPNLIPQVILMSYAGGIFFNLCADPAEVDEAVLKRAFIEELVATCDAYGLDVDEKEILYKF